MCCFLVCICVAFIAFLIRLLLLLGKTTMLYMLCLYRNNNGVAKRSLSSDVQQILLCISNIWASLLLQIMQLRMLISIIFLSKLHLHFPQNIQMQRAHTVQGVCREKKTSEKKLQLTFTKLSIY